ncbi:MAG: glycoside hydrolase family 2, partial [Planctomycetaceae bacterium]|nr:glycoside hydrolase family 2 [Planctomycetaceae bacterium]
MPTVLTLELRIPGTSTANDWDFWVFPPAQETHEPSNVLVTENTASAWEAFQQGRRVLLTAHRLGTAKKAAWMPLFWSSRFFPGQNRDTLGALIQADHPALDLFPTDHHLDWQWHRLCRDARGFVLNDLPHAYRAIVQPVSDYHYNNKLGSLFEFKSEQGGKLLVCGYNIVDDLTENPAARQLKKSLLAYLSGNKCLPDTEISRKKFDAYFPVKEIAPVAKAPAGFENAVLYVQAGANHPGQG